MNNEIFKYNHEKEEESELKQICKILTFPLFREHMDFFIIKFSKLTFKIYKGMKRRGWPSLAYVDSFYRIQLLITLKYFCGNFHSITFIKLFWDNLFYNRIYMTSSELCFFNAFHIRFKDNYTYASNTSNYF